MYSIDMTYTEYLTQSQISEQILIELGIQDAFMSIFNSHHSIDEKKQQARDIFLHAMTQVRIDMFDNREKSELDDGDHDLSESDEIDMSSSDELTVKPTHINGVKLSQVQNETSSRESIESIVQDPFFTVSHISFSKIHIRPRKPFITSTLQQAASSFLGMTPKSTMRAAQKLYEGVDINGTPTALITYMRTDSFTISPVAIEQIRSFLSAHYPHYQPAQPRIYTSKSKNSQEAHEAIRPTDISVSPDMLKGRVEPSLLKVYELIWRNTIACQMTDQIKEKKTFVLTNSFDTRFSGAFVTVLEDGWRALFTY